MTDVDTWAPLFTEHFTDEQMTRPAFVLPLDNGWCKLCDAHTEDSREEHTRLHTRELKSWRKRREAMLDRERRQRLAEVRRLKQEAKR